MSEPIASTSKCALHAQSGRGLAYDEFHRSRANGHSLRAHRALQQFFDYRFHDKSDRLHYLHALLNLAALHAEERGWEQARAALLEAVMLAKASGDKGTITSCIALMRRIDFNDPDGRLDDSSFELPDASTLATSQDQLWQVKEALKLGRPVNLAFASLYRAKVTLLSETIGPRLDRQKARWECVCSELWELLGAHLLEDPVTNVALTTQRS